MLTRKRKVFVIVLSVLLVLSVLAGLYFDYENTTLQVSHYEIVSANLPAAFHDFKIIQISDFHNTKSRKLQNSIIQTIKAEQPNLTVITGDLVDSNRTNIQVAIDFIHAIKDDTALYYVPGNHEARISDYQKLKDGLRENGVVILDNQATTWEIGGAQINLLGVNDPSMNDEDTSDERFMADTLADITYNRDNFSILLSHRPELFTVYAEHKIDLVFAGHAHGGQIRLPGIGGLLAPNQGWFPKKTSGTFTEDRTTMVVSRGIGNSLFPFRVNNRPELVIATLKTA